MSSLLFLRETPGVQAALDRFYPTSLGKDSDSSSTVRGVNADGSLWWNAIAYVPGKHESMTVYAMGLKGLRLGGKD